VAKTIYYTNGDYAAVREKDYDGNVLSYSIYRPDIGGKLGTTFYSTAGTCSSADGKLLKNPEWLAAVVEGEHKFDSCNEVEFKGKKCTKYSTKLGAFSVFVKGDDDVIGFEVLGGKQYSASFSKSCADYHFRYSSTEAYECRNKMIYESINDGAVKCAASTSKAAVAVVLAAVASALLAIF